MQKLPFVLAAVSTLALGACATPAEQPGPEEQAPEQVGDTCRVLESEGWAADIAPLPGNPNLQQLTVTGKVTMPTPNYSFAWDTDLVDGAGPGAGTPSLELRLLAKPPSGMVAQVLDTREVTYAGPAEAPNYRVISVTCEGRELARIENVS